MPDLGLLTVLILTCRDVHLSTRDGAIFGGRLQAATLGLNRAADPLNRAIIML